MGAHPGLRAAPSREIHLGHRPAWQAEGDHSKASEVEVRFTAESTERTRVGLKHRHLDRHGPGWESVADGVDGDAGWPLYLGRYGDLMNGAGPR
jgi:hypothetical protein